MSSLTIALVGAVCILGGLLGDFWPQKFLPKHHHSMESQETVKLGAGMVASMAALVLGLLISSSKSPFDVVNTGIAPLGARIILLDRALASHRPETREAREQDRLATNRRSFAWRGCTRRVNATGEDL
jgi:hypothetical protein